MKFLNCFHDDPMPPTGQPMYDYDGPAVWLNEDGQPQLGEYHPSVKLPLIELSPERLEELAAEIITRWGDPSADPEYSSRHVSFNGRHNLILYRLRTGEMLPS